MTRPVGVDYMIYLPKGCEKVIYPKKKKKKEKKKKNPTKFKGRLRNF